MNLKDRVRMLFYTLGDVSLKDIVESQGLFFQHLQTIQESAVLIALSEYKNNKCLKDLLYSVTYEAICGILTLIDGYTTDKIKIDLIDEESGVSLRKNIELHDKCADYLKCSK